MLVSFALRRCGCGWPIDKLSTLLSFGNWETSSNWPAVLISETRDLKSAWRLAAEQNPRRQKHRRQSWLAEDDRVFQSVGMLLSRVSAALKNQFDDLTRRPDVSAEDLRTIADGIHQELSRRATGRLSEFPNGESIRCSWGRARRVCAPGGPDDGVDARPNDRPDPAAVQKSASSLMPADFSPNPAFDYAPLPAGFGCAT